MSAGICSYTPAKGGVDAKSVPRKTDKVVGSMSVSAKVTSVIAMPSIADADAEGQCATDVDAVVAVDEVDGSRSNVDFPDPTPEILDAALEKSEYLFNQLTNLDFSVDRRTKKEVDLGSETPLETISLQGSEDGDTSDVVAATSPKAQATIEVPVSFFLDVTNLMNRLRESEDRRMRNEYVPSFFVEEMTRLMERVQELEGRAERNEAIARLQDRLAHWRGQCESVPSDMSTATPVSTCLSPSRLTSVSDSILQPQPIMGSAQGEDRFGCDDETVKVAVQSPKSRSGLVSAVAARNEHASPGRSGRNSEHCGVGTPNVWRSVECRVGGGDAGPPLLYSATHVQGNADFANPNAEEDAVAGRTATPSGGENIATLGVGAVTRASVVIKKSSLGEACEIERETHGLTPIECVAIGETEQPVDSIRGVTVFTPEGNPNSAVTPTSRAGKGQHDGSSKTCKGTPENTSARTAMMSGLTSSPCGERNVPPLSNLQRWVTAETRTPDVARMVSAPNPPARVSCVSVPSTPVSALNSTVTSPISSLKPSLQSAVPHHPVGEVIPATVCKVAVSPLPQPQQPQQSQQSQQPRQLQPAQHPQMKQAQAQYSGSSPQHLRPSVAAQSLSSSSPRQTVRPRTSIVLPNPSAALRHSGAACSFARATSPGRPQLVTAVSPRSPSPRAPRGSLVVDTVAVTTVYKIMRRQC
eukprot:TRINITY_DN18255_c0_g1_i1.p1 TRINITY_DN18255_c0_g1~~TRINITY_DN18255_c0_g1_i1.p1  ORF type:complete len:800 (-),score=118.29 TRINITY_DN18255_c0_g1_i1:147-2240(-)